MAKIPNTPQPDNVFVISEPSHMLAKFDWELDAFTETMFFQRKKPDAMTFAGYQAFNCAVTAWHLADWAWAYADEEKKKAIAARFGFKSKGKDRENLNLFYEALCRDSRDLHICRHIANSSKHLKLDKPDGGFQAEIGHGEIPSGPNGEMERVFGLLVIDSGKTILLDRIFARAQKYWHDLFAEFGYVKPKPEGQ
jgi:hypothetical protein